MMQSHSAKCQFGQKGRRFLNVFADNRLIVHDVQRCLEHNAIRGCAIWRIVAAPKRFQRVKVLDGLIFLRCFGAREEDTLVVKLKHRSRVLVSTSLNLFPLSPTVETNEKVFVPEKPLHQSLKSKLIGGTLGYAEGS